MKTILLIICLAVVAAACSTPRLTTDSRKWRVTYPNPNDSTLVQVKGLYTNLGRIIYNNEKGRNDESVTIPYSPIPTAAQIIAAEKIILAKQVDLFQPGGRQKMLTTKEDTIFVLNKIQSYSRFYQTYTLPDGDFLLLVSLGEAPPGEMKKYNKNPYVLFVQYNSPFKGDYYAERFLINLRTGEILNFIKNEHKFLSIPQYIKFKAEELENQIRNNTPEGKDQIIQELKQKIELLEEMNTSLEELVKHLKNRTF